MKEELKALLYSDGEMITISKDYISYFGENLAQGFGCDLELDADGKCPVWVIFGGKLYYLAKADSVKQGVAMANNFNDAFDRIVEREKGDAEWPCL